MTAGNGQIEVGKGTVYHRQTQRAREFAVLPAIELGRVCGPTRFYNRYTLVTVEKKMSSYTIRRRKNSREFRNTFATIGK